MGMKKYWCCGHGGYTKSQLYYKVYDVAAPRLLPSGMTLSRYLVHTHTTCQFSQNMFHSWASNPKTPNRPDQVCYNCCMVVVKASKAAEPQTSTSPHKAPQTLQERAYGSATDVAIDAVAGIAAVNSPSRDVLVLVPLAALQQLARGVQAYRSATRHRQLYVPDELMDAAAQIVVHTAAAQGQQQLVARAHAAAAQGQMHVQAHTAAAQGQQQQVAQAHTVAVQQQAKQEQRSPAPKRQRLPRPPGAVEPLPSGRQKRSTAGKKKDWPST